MYIYIYIYHTTIYQWLVLQCILNTIVYWLYQLRPDSRFHVDHSTIRAAQFTSGAIVVTWLWWFYTLLVQDGNETWLIQVDDKHDDKHDNSAWFSCAHRWFTGFQFAWTRLQAHDWWSGSTATPSSWLWAWQGKLSEGWLQPVYDRDFTVEQGSSQGKLATRDILMILEIKDLEFRRVMMISQQPTWDSEAWKFWDWTTKHGKTWAAYIADIAL